MSDEFFKLRYSGERFNNHHLPLDVLPDLVAFKDLLLAFAKDAWKSQNPDKKRVPNGFEKSFRLDLVDIEPGSAIPKIFLNKQYLQPSLHTHISEIEQAVNDGYLQVVALFNEYDNKLGIRNLSPKQICALNKFGSGLRSDERIEFCDKKDSNNNIIYLDAYKRIELIKKFKSSYQVRKQIFGEITGHSVANNYIEVAFNKEVINVPLETEVILSAYKNETGSSIYLDLQIEYDKTDRFIKVIEVFEIELTDFEEPCQLLQERLDRIDSFRELIQGWNNGDGEVISSLAMENAKTFLEHVPTNSIPNIYPTNEGGVLFETIKYSYDLSFEFTSDGKVIMYGYRISDGINIELKEYSKLGEELYKNIGLLLEDAENESAT